MISSICVPCTIINVYGLIDDLIVQENIIHRLTILFEKNITITATLSKNDYAERSCKHCVYQIYLKL